MTEQNGNGQLPPCPLCGGPVLPEKQGRSHHRFCSLRCWDRALRKALSSADTLEARLAAVQATWTEEERARRVRADWRPRWSVPRVGIPSCGLPCPQEGDSR
jgi:hypothetical protein